jgi:hypothetical protein
MALVPNLLRCFLAKVIGVDLHNFGFILQDITYVSDFKIVYLVSQMWH